ncbi:MAG: hypothetical protein ACM31C_31625 [Acidobacteriota bacterium]
MIGVVVLAGCVLAVLAAGWIVYQLYAPQRRSTAARPQRSPMPAIVDAAFSPRVAPQPPRSRLARGTGANLSKRPARNDRTERVEPMPFYRQ